MGKLADKGDIKFSHTENDFKTIRQFRQLVQSRYRLEGLVTMYHSGRELNDREAQLGKLFHADNSEPLVVRCDKSQAVASGGVAKGAVAISNGGKASAEGGTATGGRCYPNGLMMGGDGTGGDAMGDYGAGGEGIAGTAWNPKGKSEAGDAGGGEFRKNEQANGSTK